MPGNASILNVDSVLYLRIVDAAKNRGTAGMTLLQNDIRFWIQIVNRFCRNNKNDGPRSADSLVTAVLQHSSSTGSRASVHRADGLPQFKGWLTPLVLYNPTLTLQTALIKGIRACKVPSLPSWTSAQYLIMQLDCCRWTRSHPTRIGCHPGILSRRRLVSAT